MPPMPGIVWALINLLMAVYAGLWCLLWIVVGRVLLVLRRDAGVPLVLGYVASHGAREAIHDALVCMDYRPGHDFLMVG